MDRKLKILYVEDNKITAQETSEALEENGYEVRMVYDGNEAWAAFQESRPDVVLLNYQIPYKNGIDVFLLIRQIDASIPVLILSSYTELYIAFLKIGISDFIRKDGEIEEICARIERAWQQNSHQMVERSPIPSAIYTLSPLTTFIPSSALLIIGKEHIPLNSILSTLLTIFCQNQNIDISYSIICKRLWSIDSNNKIKLLRDYVSELRKLLNKDKSLKLCSVYQKGYRLSYSQTY